ncbi:MAG: hypothetical protein ACREA4_01810 [Nitrososphaera sp.]
MSVPFDVAQRIFAASIPRTGVRASGLRRRIRQTPGMLPPKGFNVSGFSEAMSLFFLNQVRSGRDLGGQFGAAGQGMLTPVFTRERDVATAAAGLTASLGVGADVTTDFVFEYIMHMSAWLYSGYIVTGFFQDQTVATMTFQSIRTQLAHFRNGAVVKQIFDSGTVSVGVTGDVFAALSTKLPFVEYFAVGDVLRATLSPRSTTDAGGTGNHMAVNTWGAQDAGIQPHIFLHAQPTQEIGNNALFARRV